MSSSLDYIALRAPYYSADSRVGSALSNAEIETGNSYGVNRYKAVALLVLHWLASDDSATGANGAMPGGSAGGTLVSEQEGSLKRAYQVDFSLQARYPDLSRTRWGMELIGLTKKTTMSFMTRMVSAS